MANSLDFTKIKKEYLTVKLNDDNKTVLMIGTPTKAILTEFVDINTSISESGADIEAVNDLYKICAKIMSFNKGGIRITADYLSEFFDLEDMLIFFRAYMEFISSINKAKN